MFNPLRYLPRFMLSVSRLSFGLGSLNPVHIVQSINNQVIKPIVEPAATVGFSLMTAGQSNKLLSTTSQNSTVGQVSTVAGEVAAVGAAIAVGAAAAPGTAAAISGTAESTATAIGVNQLAANQSAPGTATASAPAAPVPVAALLVLAGIAAKILFF